MDVDSVHLLDKKSQKLSLNVCLEEADVNTFNINFETNESLNEKNCKRYTQYFKHKMDVLILLQKYKDHIIKTLVYYCNVCDFVTEEKYIWDKHMDTKHSCATNNPTVHCSICSMMIIGGTYEEHLRTNEHNILLKFVQSFEPGIDNLAKNTKLIKLDDTSTSIKTFLDVEQNKLLDSSEMINIKAELLDNPNSENNCSKKNNSFLKTESSSHSKDLTITNTLSPLENCDQNENIKSVETKMSDAEWVIDLRSCLTSVKNGISLSQIENDLWKMSGTRIPFKDLGYSSLKECLIASGQFSIRNHGNVSIVYAIGSSKTQHLTDLIKKQKSKPQKIKSYLKIKNLEKIKMPESRKRKISECGNFSLCNEITKLQKYNDINKILSNISQWDIQIPNQYKRINNFECLVCNYKTCEFNDWKLHIMSIIHLSDCHKMNDLYSHVCTVKKCKVLLYGPKNLIHIHQTKHSQKIKIFGVSILMAEVMKRFITKQNNLLYFCSHCKKFDEKPIHSKKTKISFKTSVRFFCSNCNVDFHSSPEMFDYHSLSVEHMTLKCFDKLCLETSFMHSKKMKTSELTNENKKKNLLPTVYKIIDDSIPLPNVVHDISLPKTSCNEIDNKCLQTVQVDKSLANVEFRSTTLMDQKSQVLYYPIDCKTTPSNIINEKSKLDIVSICGKTASGNVKSFENEKSEKLDEDKSYGEYVTQRLNNIQNSSVKQEIKLEIDYLFYIQSKKLSQKNV